MSWLQTFQPLSHANLEVLKKSPGKPGDKDLKPWDFKNMRQMKTTMTDCFRVFFTLLVLFVLPWGVVSWPWVGIPNREGWKVCDFHLRKIWPQFWVNKNKIFPTGIWQNWWKLIMNVTPISCHAFSQQAFREIISLTKKLLQMIAVARSTVM